MGALLTYTVLPDMNSRGIWERDALEELAKHCKKTAAQLQSGNICIRLPDQAKLDTLKNLETPGLKNLLNENVGKTIRIEDPDTHSTITSYQTVDFD